MFIPLIVSSELSQSLQIALHAILATRMHRELWSAAIYQEVSSLGNISAVVFATPPSEAQESCASAAGLINL